MKYFKIICLLLLSQNALACCGGKVKYFDNTILIAEGTLKKGIPNGQWKYYGKRGELIAEISYKMGEKVGLEKHFNDDILAQLYRNNKNRIFEEYRTNEFGKISTICIHKFDKKGYCTSGKLTILMAN